MYYRYYQVQGYTLDQLNALAKSARVRAVQMERVTEYFNDTDDDFVQERYNILLEQAMDDPDDEAKKERGIT